MKHQIKIPLAPTPHRTKKKHIKKHKNNRTVNRKPQQQKRNENNRTILFTNTQKNNKHAGKTHNTKVINPPPEKTDKTQTRKRKTHLRGKIMQARPSWHLPNTFCNVCQAGKILVTVSKNLIHNNQSCTLDYFTPKFNSFPLDKIF